MTIAELAQTFESKFWLIVIPILDANGPVLKMMDYSRRLMRTRAGFLCFLFTVWAAVGFMLGLVLGKMIWIVQAL
jgi:hypothetical protein